MKELMRVRLTVKNLDGTILCQMMTYGVKLDSRTMIVEGRTFHAGRKSGFGKSVCIYEKGNGWCQKVTIDKIESCGEAA